MSGSTLTRLDLSEAVHREVGLSRNESAQLVEDVLRHVSDALVRGEQVKISGFGTFSVRQKGRARGSQPEDGRGGADPAASRPVVPRLPPDARPGRRGATPPPNGAERVAQAKSPDAFRTISEVAAEIGVEQHVLRFWETKFPGDPAGEARGRAAVLPPP